MGSTHIGVARVAEICARLLRCESQASIAKQTGVTAVTVAKTAAVLRLHGVTVETTPRSALDPAREALLHDLFATTRMSNRSIGVATGIPSTSVSKSRRRFNAEALRAGRDLPKCECGQYLHHARLCWVRRIENFKRRGFHTVSALPTDQQEEIRRQLLAGETTRAVGDRAGFPRVVIQNFTRTLTPEERRIRAESFLVTAARQRAASLAKSITRPQAINPKADPLYAAIERTVSRGIDPALRDDMISQAYLEVLEGRLDPKNLAAGVKKVRGGIFRAFANPWGNLSLNECRSDDGPDWTNEIPDERALSAFDTIEFQAA